MRGWPHRQRGLIIISRDPNYAAASESVYIDTNIPGAYQYARLTNLPPTFGVAEFTLQLWVRATNISQVGPTTEGTPGQRTNWSSTVNVPYSSQLAWTAGNFLLDGHNNSVNWENGTLDLQLYGGGRPRWLFGDGPAAAARVGRMHWVQGGTANILNPNWNFIEFTRQFVAGGGSLLTGRLNGQVFGTETSTARTDMRTWWNAWPGFPESGWFFFSEKQAANNTPGGVTQWENFKGWIGELRLWDRHVTDAESTANWQRAVTGNEGGLVGLYRFRESSGSGASDAKEIGTNNRQIVFIRTDNTLWRPETQTLTESPTWVVPGSSTLAHGQEFEITSGSNDLGTRPTSPSFNFMETMVGRTIGQIPGAPFSLDYDPVPQWTPQYNGDSSYNHSGRSIRIGLGNKAGTGGGDNVLMIVGNWQEVYVSVRMRLLVNAVGPNTQLKLPRLMGIGPAPYSASPGMHPNTWYSGAQQGNFYVDCLGLGSNDNAYYAQFGQPNSNGAIWNVQQMYSRLGSPGQNNGRRWVAMNRQSSFVQSSGSGLPGGQFSGALPQAGLNYPAGPTVTLGSGADSNFIGRIMMPFYFTADGGDLTVYLGEVHVQANTVADGSCAMRVELTDNPSYTSSTIFVAQRIVSWVPNRVVCEGNRGSFANGQQAYAHLLNADGTVNSRGQAGTWGAA